MGAAAIGAATGSAVVIVGLPPSGGAPSATAKPELVLTSDDILYSVALSPDGRRIAAGGRSETVYVWSLPGGTIANVLRMASGPRACCLQTACIMATAWVGPNAVLSGGYGGNATLWSLAPSLLDGNSDRPV